MSSGSDNASEGNTASRDEDEDYPYENDDDDNTSEAEEMEDGDGENGDGEEADGDGDGENGGEGEEADDDESDQFDLFEGEVSDKDSDSFAPNENDGEIGSDGTSQPDEEEDLEPSSNARQSMVGQRAERYEHHDGAPRHNPILLVAKRVAAMPQTIDAARSIATITPQALVAIGWPLLPDDARLYPPYASLIPDAPEMQPSLISNFLRMVAIEFDRRQLKLSSLYHIRCAVVRKALSDLAATRTTSQQTPADDGVVKGGMIGCAPRWETLSNPAVDACSSVEELIALTSAGDSAAADAAPGFSPTFPIDLNLALSISRPLDRAQLLALHRFVDGVVAVNERPGELLTAGVRQLFAYLRDSCQKGSAVFEDKVLLSLSFSLLVKLALMAQQFELLLSVLHVSFLSLSTFEPLRLFGVSDGKWGCMRDLGNSRALALPLPEEIFDNCALEVGGAWTTTTIPLDDAFRAALSNSLPLVKAVFAVCREKSGTMVIFADVGTLRVSCEGTASDPNPGARLLLFNAARPVTLLDKVIGAAAATQGTGAILLMTSRGVCLKYCTTTLKFLGETAVPRADRVRGATVCLTIPDGSGNPIVCRPVFNADSALPRVPYFAAGKTYNGSFARRKTANSSLFSMGTVSSPSFTIQFSLFPVALPQGMITNMRLAGAECGMVSVSVDVQVRGQLLRISLTHASGASCIVETSAVLATWTTWTAVVQPTESASDSPFFWRVFENGRPTAATAMARVQQGHTLSVTSPGSTSEVAVTVLEGSFSGFVRGLEVFVGAKSIDWMIQRANATKKGNNVTESAKGAILVSVPMEEGCGQVLACNDDDGIWIASGDPLIWRECPQSVRQLKQQKITWPMPLSASLCVVKVDVNTMVVVDNGFTPEGNKNKSVVVVLWVDRSTGHILHSQAKQLQPSVDTEWPLLTVDKSTATWSRICRSDISFVVSTFRPTERWEPLAAKAPTAGAAPMTWGDVAQGIMKMMRDGLIQYTAATTPLGVSFVPGRPLCIARCVTIARETLALVKSNSQSSVTPFHSSLLAVVFQYLLRTPTYVIRSFDQELQAVLGQICAAAVALSGAPVVSDLASTLKERLTTELLSEVAQLKCITASVIHRRAVLAKSSVPLVPSPPSSVQQSELLPWLSLSKLLSPSSLYDSVATLCASNALAELKRLVTVLSEACVADFERMLLSHDKLDSAAPTQHKETIQSDIVLFHVMISLVAQKSVDASLMVLATFELMCTQFVEVIERSTRSKEKKGIPRAAVIRVLQRSALGAVWFSVAHAVPDFFTDQPQQQKQSFSEASVVLLLDKASSVQRVASQLHDLVLKIPVGIAEAASSKAENVEVRVAEAWSCRIPASDTATVVSFSIPCASSVTFTLVTGPTSGTLTPQRIERITNVDAANHFLLSTIELLAGGTRSAPTAGGGNFTVVVSPSTLPSRLAALATVPVQLEVQPWLEQFRQAVSLACTDLAAAVLSIQPSETLKPVIISQESFLRSGLVPDALTSKGITLGAPGYSERSDLLRAHALYSELVSEKTTVVTEAYAVWYRVFESFRGLDKVRKAKYEALMRLICAATAWHSAPVASGGDLAGKPSTPLDQLAAELGAAMTKIRQRLPLIMEAMQQKREGELAARCVFLVSRVQPRLRVEAMLATQTDSSARTTSTTSFGDINRSVTTFYGMQREQSSGSFAPTGSGDAFSRKAMEAIRYRLQRQQDSLQELSETSATQALEYIVRGRIVGCEASLDPTVVETVLFDKVMRAKRHQVVYDVLRRFCTDDKRLLPSVLKAIVSAREALAPQRKGTSPLTDRTEEFMGCGAVLEEELVQAYASLVEEVLNASSSALDDVPLLYLAAFVCHRIGDWMKLGCARVLSFAEQELLKGNRASEPLLPALRVLSPTPRVTVFPLPIGVNPEDTDVATVARDEHGIGIQVEGGNFGVSSESPWQTDVARNRSVDVLYYEMSFLMKTRGKVRGVIGLSSVKVTAADEIPSELVAQMTHKGMVGKIKFTDNWKVGDVVGCGFQVHSRTIFFTHNGRLLGSLKEAVDANLTHLFPCIGVGSNVGIAKIVINFGEMTSFAFDITSMSTAALCRYVPDTAREEVAFLSLYFAISSCFDLLASSATPPGRKVAAAQQIEQLSFVVHRILVSRFGSSTIDSVIRLLGVVAECLTIEEGASLVTLSTLLRAVHFLVRRCAEIPSDVQKLGIMTLLRQVLQKAPEELLVAAVSHLSNDGATAQLPLELFESVFVMSEAPTAAHQPLSLAWTKLSKNVLIGSAMLPSEHSFRVGCKRELKGTQAPAGKCYFGVIRGRPSADDCVSLEALQAGSRAAVAECAIGSDVCMWVERDPLTGKVSFITPDNSNAPALAAIATAVEGEYYPILWFRSPPSAAHNCSLVGIATNTANKTETEISNSSLLRATVIACAQEMHAVAPFSLLVRRAFAKTLSKAVNESSASELQVALEILGSSPTPLVCRHDGLGLLAVRGIIDQGETCIVLREGNSEEESFAVPSSTLVPVKVAPKIAVRNEEAAREAVNLVGEMFSRWLFDCERIGPLVALEASERLSISTLCDKELEACSKHFVMLADAAHATQATDITKKVPQFDVLFDRAHQSKRVRLVTPWHVAGPPPPNGEEAHQLDCISPVATEGVRCAQGHPLYRGRPREPWRCSIDSCDFEALTPAEICPICPFSMCTKCLLQRLPSERPSPLRCPKEHPLVIAGCDNNLWSCDICHLKSPSNIRHRCDKCNYHMCDGCAISACCKLNGNCSLSFGRFTADTSAPSAFDCSVMILSSEPPLFIGVVDASRMPATYDVPESHVLSHGQGLFNMLSGRNFHVGDIISMKRCAGSNQLIFSKKSANPQSEDVVLATVGLGDAMSRAQKLRPMFALRNGAALLLLRRDGAFPVRSPAPPLPSLQKPIDCANVKCASCASLIAAAQQYYVAPEGTILCSSCFSAWRRPELRLCHSADLSRSPLVISPHCPKIFSVGQIVHVDTAPCGQWASDRCYGTSLDEYGRLCSIRPHAVMVSEPCSLFGSHRVDVQLTNVVIPSQGRPLTDTVAYNPRWSRVGPDSEPLLSSSAVVIAEKSVQYQFEKSLPEDSIVWFSIAFSCPNRGAMLATTNYVQFGVTTRKGVDVVSSSAFGSSDSDCCFWNSSPELSQLWREDEESNEHEFRLFVAVDTIQRTLRFASSLQQLGTAPSFRIAKGGSPLRFVAFANVSGIKLIVGSGRTSGTGSLDDAPIWGLARADRLVAAPQDDTFISMLPFPRFVLESSTVLSLMWNSTVCIVLVDGEPLSRVQLPLSFRNQQLRFIMFPRQLGVQASFLPPVDYQFRSSFAAVIKTFGGGTAALVEYAGGLKQYVARQCTRFCATPLLGQKQLAPNVPIAFVDKAGDETVFSRGSLLSVDEAGSTAIVMLSGAVRPQSKPIGSLYLTDLEDASTIAPRIGGNSGAAPPSSGTRVLEADALVTGSRPNFNGIIFDCTTRADIVISAVEVLGGTDATCNCEMFISQRSSHQPLRFSDWTRVYSNSSQSIEPRKKFLLTLSTPYRVAGNSLFAIHVNCSNSNAISYFTDPDVECFQPVYGDETISIMMGKINGTSDSFGSIRAEPCGFMGSIMYQRITSEPPYCLTPLALEKSVLGRRHRQGCAISALPAATSLVDSISVTVDVLCEDVTLTEVQMDVVAVGRDDLVRVSVLHVTTGIEQISFVGCLAGSTSGECRADGGQPWSRSIALPGGHTVLHRGKNVLKCDVVSESSKVRFVASSASLGPSDTITTSAGEFVRFSDGKFCGTLVLKTAASQRKQRPFEFEFQRGHGSALERLDNSVGSSHGIMFDVTAHCDLTIDSLIPMSAEDKEEPALVQLFFKRGSFAGCETSASASAWKKVFHGQLTLRRLGYRLPVGNIRLREGEKVAFYVCTGSYNGVVNSRDEALPAIGKVFETNGHISVHVGKRRDSSTPFQDIPHYNSAMDKRAMVGTFEYHIETDKELGPSTTILNAASAARMLSVLSTLCTANASLASSLCSVYPDLRRIAAAGIDTDANIDVAKLDMLLGFELAKLDEDSKRTNAVDLRPLAKASTALTSSRLAQGTLVLNVASQTIFRLLEPLDDESCTSVKGCLLGSPAGVSETISTSSLLPISCCASCGLPPQGFSCNSDAAQATCQCAENGGLPDSTSVHLVNGLAHAIVTNLEVNDDVAKEAAKGIVYRHRNISEYFTDDGCPRHSNQDRSNCFEADDKSSVTFSLNVFDFLSNLQCAAASGEDYLSAFPVIHHKGHVVALEMDSNAHSRRTILTLSITTVTATPQQSMFDCSYARFTLRGGEKEFTSGGSFVASEKATTVFQLRESVGIGLLTTLATPTDHCCEFVLTIDRNLPMPSQLPALVPPTNPPSVSSSDLIRVNDVIVQLPRQRYNAVGVVRCATSASPFSLVHLVDLKHSSPTTLIVLKATAGGVVNPTDTFEVVPTPSVLQCKRELMFPAYIVDDSSELTPLAIPVADARLSSTLADVFVGSAGNDNTRLLTLNQRIDVMARIWCAVEHYHAHGSAHGHIAPQNVFLQHSDGDDSLCNAVLWSAARMVSTAPWFYDYVAPETVNGGVRNYATDIWTCGVLSRQLLMPAFDALLFCAGKDVARTAETYLAKLSILEKVSKASYFTEADITTITNHFGAQAKLGKILRSVAKMLSINPSERSSLGALIRESDILSFRADAEWTSGYRLVDQVKSSSAGLYFNIVARSHDIDVKEIAFVVGIDTVTEARLYIREEGTFSGFEVRPEAWKLVTTQSLKCAGCKATLTGFDAIRIRHGVMVGFYICTNKIDGISSYSSVTELRAAAEVQEECSHHFGVTAGKAALSIDPFRSIGDTMSRYFCGTIHFAVVDAAGEKRSVNLRSELASSAGEVPLVVNGGGFGRRCRNTSNGLLATSTGVCDGNHQLFLMDDGSKHWLPSTSTEPIAEPCRLISPEILLCHSNASALCRFDLQWQQTRTANGEEVESPFGDFSEPSSGWASLRSEPITQTTLLCLKILPAAGNNTRQEFRVGFAVGDSAPHSHIHSWLNADDDVIMAYFLIDYFSHQVYTFSTTPLGDINVESRMPYLVNLDLLTEGRPIAAILQRDECGMVGVTLQAAQYHRDNISRPLAERSLVAVWRVDKRTAYGRRSMTFHGVDFSLGVEEDSVTLAGQVHDLLTPTRHVWVSLAPHNGTPTQTLVMKLGAESQETWNALVSFSVAGNHFPLTLTIRIGNTVPLFTPCPLFPEQRSLISRDLPPIMKGECHRVVLEYDTRTERPVELSLRCVGVDEVVRLRVPSPVVELHDDLNIVSRSPCFKNRMRGVRIELVVDAAQMEWTVSCDPYPLAQGSIPETSAIRLGIAGDGSENSIIRIATWEMRRPILPLDEKSPSWEGVRSFIARNSRRTFACFSFHHVADAGGLCRYSEKRQLSRLADECTSTLVLRHLVANARVLVGAALLNGEMEHHVTLESLSTQGSEQQVAIMTKLSSLGSTHPVAMTRLVRAAITVVASSSHFGSQLLQCALSVLSHSIDLFPQLMSRKLAPSLLLAIVRVAIVEARHLRHAALRLLLQLSSKGVALPGLKALKVAMQPLVDLAASTGARDGDSSLLQLLKELFAALDACPEVAEHPKGLPWAKLTLPFTLFAASKAVSQALLSSPPRQIPTVLLGIGRGYSFSSNPNSAGLEFKETFEWRRGKRRVEYCVKGHRTGVVTVGWKSTAIVPAAAGNCNTGGCAVGLVVLPDGSVHVSRFGKRIQRLAKYDPSDEIFVGVMADHDARHWQLKVENNHETPVPNETTINCESNEIILLPIVLLPTIISTECRDDDFIDMRDNVSVLQQDGITVDESITPSVHSVLRASYLLPTLPQSFLPQPQGIEFYSQLAEFLDALPQPLRRQVIAMARVTPPLDDVFVPLTDVVAFPLLQSHTGVVSGGEVCVKSLAPYLAVLLAVNKLARNFATYCSFRRQSPEMARVWEAFRPIATRKTRNLTMANIEFLDESDGDPQSVTVYTTNATARRSELATLRHSVFGQIHEQLCTAPLAMFCGTPMFTVKLAGFAAQDAGGPYREVLSLIGEEIMQSHPSGQYQMNPLFVPVRKSGGSDELDVAVMPNPVMALSSQTALQLEFFGKLLGNFLTQPDIIAVNLPPLFWKLLLRHPVGRKDLVEMDENFFNTLSDANAMDLSELEIRFPGLLAAWEDAHSSNEPVAANAVTECIVQLELHRYDTAIDFIRKGLSKIVPLPLMCAVHWADVRLRICGEPQVTVKALQQETEISVNEEQQTMFWEVLRGLSSKDRSLLLKFATGQRRLPLRGKLKIQASADKDGLPTSGTCFMTLYLPQYSSERVMSDRLLYAVRQCNTIDRDGTTEEGLELD